MGLLTEPIILCSMYLKQYPASLGTRSIHLTTSNEPISIRDHFFQPRLKNVGPFTRKASDLDGNYQVGSCTLTINDEDGEIYALLEAGATTEYWVNREVVLWLVSREYLRTVTLLESVESAYRGIITDYQQRGRTVEVTLTDLLGSQMSGFNLGKKVLQTAIKDLTNHAREQDKDYFLPAMLGEFSDRGSPDVDGHSVLKAIVPVREVCEVDITALSGGVPDTPAPTSFVDPPVITGSGVVGTTGEKAYDYAATTVTGYGESAFSNIVTINGAVNRNLSNYNWLEGTYDNGGSSPYNTVRIWRRDSPSGAWYALDEAGYFLPEGTFGYADGAAPVTGPSGTGVTRDEEDKPKAVPVPTGAYAQTNQNIWSIMGVCLGYDYDIEDIYASDLAEGTEPKRTLVLSAEHGVTFLTPDDDLWPFPDPWIEMNGVKFTGFLARGHKVNHHRDGIVTMAVNVCGPKIGGVLVNQMFRQFSMFINEYALKNKGTGWRNQVYGTLETFHNGDPMIETSGFEDAEALSKEYLGDSVGYIGHVWVQDPETTWRDVIAHMCRSSGGRFFPNRFGQVAFFLEDTRAVTVTGKHFQERIQIKRHADPILGHQDVINRILWQYFWDLDGGRYRGTGLKTENDISIAAHVPDGVVGTNDTRGVKKLDLDIAFTNDLATATDVVNRELVRRARRPRYPVEVFDLAGFDHDIGEYHRLTNTYGNNMSPVIILGLDVDLWNQEIALTFLERLVGSTSGASVVTSGAHQVGDSLLIPPTSHQVGDSTAVPPTSNQVG